MCTTTSQAWCTKPAWTSRASLGRSRRISSRKWNMRRAPARTPIACLSAPACLQCRRPSPSATSRTSSRRSIRSFLPSRSKPPAESQHDLRSLMPERRKLNVAMIGYGFMGRAHSNAFHQVGRYFDNPFDLRLKIVCGRNEAKLGKMASDWGWEETASDWEEVVSRPDIDVVDICTPNYLHEPI